MAKYLKLEEDSNHPVTLLIDTSAGVENTFLQIFSEKLKDSLKLYALTQKKLPSHVERLSSLSIHFLDKLTKEPSYVLIFLGESSQKRKTFEIIEKLIKGKTLIVVVISYRQVDDFIDLLQACKGKKGIVFALLGDMFGAQVKNTPLTKIIQKALAQREITLSGDDLSPLFPISQEDAVSGVQHVMFGLRDESFIYSLFYDHPQTTISLSHVLKRLEPELSITFGKNAIVFPAGKTSDEVDRLIKQKIGIVPASLDVSFEGFEKSVEYLALDKLPNYVPSKRRLGVEVSKRSSLKLVSQLVGYITFSFFLFLACSFILFFGSVFEFRNGIKALSAGNISESRRDFEISKNLYVPSQEVIKFIFAIPTLFGQNEPLKYLTMYGVFTSEVNQVTSVIEKSLAKNPSISKEEVKSITASVFNFFFLTQELAEAKISDYIKLEKGNIPSDMFAVLYVLPSVLGYDAPRSYLILLQNNNELRPTGGFIGSVAYVTINKGKIETPVIQDVYDLDGQLKGHIEPPYVVRRYLQPHLYLRDSNFDPEFSNSASTSALLYNLESGRNIDGVIAIDTEVLKTLLDIEGSITIPGQSEKLTSKNIVGVLQNSIEDNSFPGSAEKKLALNALMGHIISDFEQNKKKKLSFMQKLPSLLSEKHILISYAKPSLEKAFIASSIAGSQLDTRLVKKDTVSDYISLNEANIGVNKVNESVDRKVEYSALLKKSSLDSDLLVTFKNSGNVSYKSYVRFMIPEGASLLKVIIDGQEQKVIKAVTDPAEYEKKGFKSPSGLEVNEATVQGRKEIGFIIEVTPSTSQRVRILYEKPLESSEEGFSKYSLLYIKQPGTLPYSLSVLLQSDGTYNIKNSSPFLFDSVLKTDKEFASKLLRAK